MRIHATNPTPIFQQIADGIRGDVARGVYRPGDPIPSIRALAVELIINPNTVKRAYEELEREGLIYAKKGLGMFVAERTASGARRRAAEDAKQDFSRGIATGLGAGMGRDEIDDAYARAWREAGETGAMKSGAKQNGSGT